MGCFSWFTQDKSHKRIVIGTGTYYMVGKVNGAIVSYEEKNYNGYGVFGGKDYYELMAEMNGKTLSDFDGDRDKLRKAGIDMAFDGSTVGYSDKWVHPSLSTIKDDWHDGDAPMADEDQGFPVW